MLSEKAKLQLKMFLTTFQQETGFRPTNIDFWGHDGENNEEQAEELQQKFSMKRNNFETSSSVSKSFIALDDHTECSIYYTFRPEEVGEEPVLCDDCGNPMTEEEQLAPFLEETCIHCYKERTAEIRHQQSEYRRAVL